MKKSIQLENEAQKICDESSKSPKVFELSPEQGRMILNNIQSNVVHNYPIQYMKIKTDNGKWGFVDLYIIVPNNYIYGSIGSAIFYIHGAGWVFGNFNTHFKLICELAIRTKSIVFFPEYSLSPEAKYPIAIEQCYNILCNLSHISYSNCLKINFQKLTVAGDSVGGNMATVMTIMSKDRNGPKIHKQLMFYPVTSANFNTNSYNEFSEGYYLYKQSMIWFWNQYTKNLEERNEITASPLNANIEQLSNLPQALIINGEVDILRDEGEAYAHKLREAGIEVTAARFQAIIHDFVMLNTLDNTNACRGAMNLAVNWINEKNRI